MMKEHLTNPCLKGIETFPWPCWVTDTNVGRPNRFIFSDCLFVSFLRTHNVSPDGRGPPKQPLLLRTTSLSLIFYRSCRANQPISQRSGARDATGPFKRRTRAFDIWRPSFYSLYTSAECRLRMCHGRPEYIFYSNFEFHRLYSVKGHELKKDAFTDSNPSTAAK